MERLTKPTIGCFKYGLSNFEHKPKEFADYDAFYAYNMAVKRLGEYEDTGLTPEEIENLKIELESMRSAANSLKMHYKKAKSEAIKEFSEKLKVRMQLEDDCNFDCNICMYECKEYIPLIDELVKEMTEEKNYG